MTPLLITHIIIALTGIGITTVLLLSPSKRKLNLSGLFLAGTLTTGTILVISSSSHMLQSCIMGLLYTAFVVGGIAIAKRKLAKENSTL